MTPETLPDPIAVAVAFTGLLERLGVRYVVVGSLASSVHGEPRSTNDIDVLADFDVADVGEFVKAVTPDYYVSEPAVREAVRSGTSFNVIHLRTAVKVDVFIAGEDPFDRERIRLGKRLEVSRERTASMVLDTAEHSILRKLEWYRRGGEVSERQWRNVLAMLRIQGPELNASRLDAWAGRLGVADLLQRARTEAAS